MAGYGAQVLSEGDISAVLGEALRTGAEWSDLYVERRSTTSVRVSNGAVEQIGSGLDVGAGVRVVRGDLTAYACTDLLSRDALLDAARAAAAALDGTGSAEVRDLTRRGGPATAAAQPDAAQVERAAKVDLALRCEAAARAEPGGVSSVSVSYTDAHVALLMAGSSGFVSEDNRVRTRLMCRAVARADGLVQRANDDIAGTWGLELFREHTPEDLGRRVAARAVRLLDSDPPPTGEMPVILAKGGAGVFFHEACGHGLEADTLVLGESVFAGRAGQRVGSPLLTGVDDPTLAGGYGSYAFDDEGTPSTPTPLLDQGVLVGDLTDLRSADALHRPGSNGHGRRQSYAHLPQPRMSNSFISPGADDPAAILADTRSGLFCEGLGGGEVDPATGEFSFRVTEAYLVENGELTRRIRGAHLTGRCLETLSLVDAVGTDFASSQALCGKAGQSVPVTYGAPTLRARMRVGGG
ncbi:MAG: TldD protein [Actinomycetota bacterium]|nr:TldD protein [Actinomycetota bacterium]